jgi:hypothetical protein
MQGCVGVTLWDWTDKAKKILLIALQYSTKIFSHKHLLVPDIFDRMGAAPPWTRSDPLSRLNRAPPLNDIPTL